MSKIYLISAFAIVILVVMIVYLDSKGELNTEIVQQTFTNLKKETTKFTDGSEISYLVPEAPTSDSTITQLPDTNQTNGDNSTAVILPEENVPQYSKDDPRGVVVTGFILLKDEVTGNNIKPYTYKVLVTIICDEEKNLVDGFNYCTTKDIFGRIETENGGKDEDGKDLGGFYEYKWHPKFTDSAGVYTVEILVTKDQPQLDGTYKDYSKSYQIQVL